MQASANGERTELYFDLVEELGDRVAGGFDLLGCEPESDGAEIGKSFESWDGAGRECAASEIQILKAGLWWER